MKVKVCPKCGKHNLESAWMCVDCEEMLSIDTLGKTRSDQLRYSLSYKHRPRNIKAYQRKKSIGTENDINIAWLTLASLAFSIGLFFFVPYAIDEGGWAWVMVLIFALMDIFCIWDWYKLIKNTMVMNRGSAIATATIINKEKRTSSYYDEYGGRGTTTAYSVYIKFKPRQAEHHHTRHITISAQLNKGFWERLDKGHKINVRYATEDPLILSIEGE